MMKKTQKTQKDTSAVAPDKGAIQIELGGQQRALKFNMHAIEIAVQHAGKTEQSNLAAIIYGGLCGDSFTKMKPICDESLEEIVEWAEEILLDDNPQRRIALIGAFKSSRGLAFLLEQKAK